MAKPKKAEQATTVVYCGPSIPGVAKQYTAYTLSLIHISEPTRRS